jgi:serine protease Do
VTSLSRFVFSCALGIALLLSFPGGLAPVYAQARVSLPDFADLVEKVGPTVVAISTTSRNRNARMPFPFRAPSPQGPDDPAPSGSGSGFLISADGFLLTNHHVVTGADEITVTLADKREFKGRLVGSDENTDVAVVKIEAAGLPFLRAGEYDKLRVGEWVLAIGSPFGLEQTVTAGIVSAKDREIGDYLRFIQTDAAVNPGNSGGPLLNVRGEVVGINSQILSRTGGFQGISLAIPIDEALRIADSLRSTGRVVRGRLGIGLDDVTKDMAEALKLPKNVGVAITTVEADSAADKAGMKAGDVILKFENKTITRTSELRRLVGGTKPGNKVTLSVWQQGKIKDIQAVVGEFLVPQSAAATRPNQPSEKPVPSVSGAAAATFGMSLTELPEPLKQASKLRSGVLVNDVAPGGPAARSGIRKGDILLTLNAVELTSLAKFNEQVALLDRNMPAALFFWREGVGNYVAIRPSPGK